MKIESRLALAILNGFDAFFAEYQNITLGAQARFEAADWHGVQQAMRDRLDLYKQKRGLVAQSASIITSGRVSDRDIWAAAKDVYAELIQNHDNYEIAESFFNSVYCYVFKHEKVRDLHAFVLESRGCHEHNADSILRKYRYEGEISPLVRQVLSDCEFNIPWEDMDRDVARIEEVILEQVRHRLSRERGEVLIEVLESVFFRSKAAYVVGRILNGDVIIPFVLPILHNENGGVYVDTALLDPDDISIVFSFTRSYFMVHASIPSEYVAFLRQLMPHKDIFELYMVIGMPKHGKTEFYRFAVADTLSSTDPYVTAPGIKGMVMLVFTRPDFGYVYKVIKDRFTPPKEMSEKHVKACYQLVKRSERGGRMADTQEFNMLAFDKRRFSEELLEELYREAPSKIEEHGNVLLLKHVYIERKMVPLNLYLSDATDEELLSVMDEYGNAIKQLAANNIFPGDMLLKNFGVTRHGRVVFYDYDEICLLTDCNFRRIPEPRTEEEEMAATPWYQVGPNDIFPEEFRLFFSGNQRAKKVFDKLHSDLYEPDWWQNMQQQIRDGYVPDIFPYRKSKRFEVR